MKVLSTLCLILLCFAKSDGQNIEPLINSLEQLLEKHRTPGAMISIVRKDRVLFTGGIGYANVEQEEKVTDKHLFRLGSVSKSFTALAILKLVEAGKLKLSDKILDIVPYLPIQNNWADTNPITIANLLEHTAGFDDMHFHSLYNNEDVATPPLKKVVLKHKSSLVARWQPGTRMSYSNVGYVVAGCIVEEIAGMPFHLFLEKTILKPIGMKDSGFYFAPPPAHVPVATGYKYKDGAYKISPFLSMNIEPAGSLCSTAADIEKFLQFMLNSKADTLLSQASLERMESPATGLATALGLTYGYGLGNGNSWIKGYHFHGHNGGIDGFGSDYKYSKEADLAVAISINTLISPKPLLDEIFDYFLEEEKPSTARQLQPIPQVLRDKYQGFYTNKSPRHQRHIFIDQVSEGMNLEFRDKFVLASTMFGEPIDTLWYAGQHQFYWGQKQLPSNMFLEDEHKRPILISSFSYHQKTSKTYQWTRFIVLMLSLASLLLYLIYGVVWAAIQLLKGKSSKYRPRLILWLACLGFIMIPLGLGLTILNMKHANEINVAGLSIFLGSLLFFALSFVAVFLSFRQKQETKAFQLYYGTTALLVCVLGMYLYCNDVIGFMMWSY